MPFPDRSRDPVTARSFDVAWNDLPHDERTVIETIVRDRVDVAQTAMRLGLDVADAKRLAAQGMKRLRRASPMVVGRAGLEPATDGL